MTKQNNAPLDFDDKANYLAEVQVEQGGEQVAEGGGNVGAADDAGQFEQATLAAVAEAGEAIAPTSEVVEQIAQIEQEIRGGVSVENAGLPADVENAIGWLKKNGAYSEKFSQLTPGQIPDKEFIEQMIHTLRSTPKEKHTKVDGGFIVERYDTDAGENALQEYLKRLG